MPYPVTFEVDYAERRDRLTVFFRLILGIPILIWVYIYGIVAAIAQIFCWFAIIITGRFPKGLYEFTAGYVRLLAVSTAYLAVLTDAYPPFDPGAASGYPVRMQFARLEDYNRLKTFFRFILAIPVAILRYVIGLLLEVAAVAAWFTILITGTLPRGLFDMMVLANSYVARSDAYLFLLTETYPPFQDEQTRAAGIADLG